MTDVMLRSYVTGGAAMATDGELPARLSLSHVVPIEARFGLVGESRAAHDGAILDAARDSSLAGLGGVGLGGVGLGGVDLGGAELGHGEGEGAEPVRPLGRWFERVHLAALSTPGVAVLAANAPLRVGGRTIGELDVLYRQDGRVVHREVAVKYYLAAKPGRDPSAWVGPGKRDRLDLKLERLATHQITVAS